MKDSLGDRMKGYEHTFRYVLPRRTYTILRLDGRAFHTYLRGSNKPFDYDFIDQMSDVAIALCEEIGGAQFAYHQSDEISILVTDFESVQTQPWFGGVIAKWLSVSASLASVIMTTGRGTGTALFDARVFTLSDPVEVANYFVWRQKDAVRNSVSMLAQHYFSHKQLHGVNSDQMQEMLFQEHKVNWNDVSAQAKRGVVIAKVTDVVPISYMDKRTVGLVTVDAQRSWWTADPAEYFTAQPDGWLATKIPELPRLVGNELARVTVVEDGRKNSRQQEI